MKLRFISRYESIDKKVRTRQELINLKQFVKKELFTLSEKQLNIAVYTMKL